MYLNGSREGTLMFYNRNTCPIGTVNFFWRPSQGETKTLWIWVHPGLFDDVVKELSLTFGFPEVPVSKKSFITENCGCRMSLLRDSFNRFRIRGPLTVGVLGDTLKLPKSPARRPLREDPTWSESFYAESVNENSFALQRDFFQRIKTLNSPGQLPRGSVMALTVLDPRIFLPEKRAKSVLSQDDLKEVHKVPDSVPDSPLWEAAVRERVRESFTTTNEINKLRNGNLVPGVQNDGEIDENFVAKVPIILVQNPGVDSGEKSTGKI